MRVEPDDPRGKYAGGMPWIRTRDLMFQVLVGTVTLVVVTLVVSWAIFWGLVV